MSYIHLHNILKIYMQDNTLSLRKVNKIALSAHLLIYLSGFGLFFELVLVFNKCYIKDFWWYDEFIHFQLLRGILFRFHLIHSSIVVWIDIASLKIFKQLFLLTDILNSIFLLEMKWKLPINKYIKLNCTSIYFFFILIKLFNNLL